MKGGEGITSVFTPPTTIFLVVVVAVVVGGGGGQIVVAGICNSPTNNVVCSYFANYRIRKPIPRDSLQEGKLVGLFCRKSTEGGGGGGQSSYRQDLRHHSRSHLPFQ